jgi:predicted peptidase
MTRTQRFENLPVKIVQEELTTGGATLTYGLTIPKTPPDAAGYPLVLALHFASNAPGMSPYFGLGFVGQLVLPALEDLGAIIVAPDAPEASWSHPRSERAVIAIVNDVKKKHPVNARRALVTGFSMGGAGAWFVAATHGEVVQAAIPIAAMPDTTDPKWTDRLRQVPLYVIHSRQDTVVPFEPVERAVRTLEAAGGRVTLVPVDDASHHQTAAYIEPLHGALPWIRKMWAEVPPPIVPDRYSNRR